MLTVQWCLFDLFNKGRLPPLSSCELSCAATFSIIQLWTLFCSSVHGCLCSEASVFLFFFYGWRWRGGEQNTIHSTRSTECLFIFPAPMPFWSFRIPGEGSALSHSLYLLVLMLMHESRLEDGGWEIDHRRMSVRGTLDIHNCFSRF